jgi:hypothetical protein
VPAADDVYALSARVLRRIDLDFPAAAPAIRRALARTRLPLVAAEQAALLEQIHASVLRLARSDGGRFERALRNGCVDWRDVVVAAGLERPDDVTAYLERP